MHRPSETEHAPEMVHGFRHRGHRDVSRIENFSDAVFGLSMTLLVVSTQVPRTFDELLRAVAGFPSFALTFGLLAEIWYVQYRFFRRYALRDGTTILLNFVLLFVIVFFTFPLKFLFSLATHKRVGEDVIRNDQIAQMYVLYAVGYAAVFLIFLLLHAHALRKRNELELTPLERFDTRRSMFFAMFQIIVAAVSVGLAEFFSNRGAYGAAAQFGGMAYLLVPVGIWLIIGLSATARRRLT